MEKHKPDWSFVKWLIVIITCIIFYKEVIYLITILVSLIVYFFTALFGIALMRR